MRGDRRPRAPVELREALGFRRARSPVTHDSATLNHHQAGDAAEAGPPPILQIEQYNLTTGTANGDDPWDEWAFPNAADECVEPINRSHPRHPDQADLAGVIEGLAGQRERYRRQWRERHEKGLTSSQIAANENTQQLYLKCGSRLLAQYVRTIAPGMEVEDADPNLFVDWLLALRPLWDDSTWRFYRASAVAVVQTIPSEHMNEARALLYSAVSVERESKAPNHEPRLTLRAGRIDQDHLEKLKSKLGTSRGKLAAWLKDWLDAGISTGLDPAEWPLSYLEMRPDENAPRGRRLWLHIVMGHLQCNWFAHRTIDISALNDETIEAIERMIENARNWARAGEFATRQADVTRLLQATSKLNFPRMKLQYDLHGLREQFIENMKTIYDDAEVAALLGQLSLKQVRKHYGKRRAAWSQVGPAPRPLPRLVNRMRRQLKIYEELRELKELKDDWRQTKAERRADRTED